MSRLKQQQIIDNAINSIAFVAKNQCSLSIEDLTVLNEALDRLRLLKTKKGKTNEQIQEEIARVVELIIGFFKK
jgi:hypothetical protein